MLALLLGMSVIGSVALGAPADTPCSCEVCRCSTAHTPHECAAESNNFVVRSFVGGPAAEDVSHHCEAICSQLRSEMFGREESARWQPKCKIVLHATRRDYLNAVGRGGGQTVGSSAITLSGGRVTGRRIDLLASGAEQGLAALPHEMIHVLFADAFPTTAPPKWTEEGLALLMDSADKRARHGRDLDAAIQSRSTLPLARLLADAEYPAPSQRVAFYAQSLSIVEYLLQLDSPKQFMRFVKLSTESGHDYALSAVYGIDSRTLDRRWWQHATEIRLASADSR